LTETFPNIYFWNSTTLMEWKDWADNLWRRKHCG